jgi:hypothetical protein
MGDETNVTDRSPGAARPGGGAWTAAASRLAVALSTLFLVLFGILFDAKSIRTFVPLGLPVTVVFSVGFYFVMKYDWEDAVAVDREKSAGNGNPGTGEERGG